MSDSKVENNTETKSETKNEAKDESMAAVKVESKNSDSFIYSPKTVTCNCYVSNLLEHKLYYCDQKGCEMFTYCDECIEYEHKFSERKKAFKKGHKLDRNKLTCVNKLFKNIKYDKAQIHEGKVKLLRLHGQIVYDKKEELKIAKMESSAVGLGVAGAIGWETHAILSAGKHILYHGEHFVKHIKGGGGIMAAVVFGGELIQNSIQLAKREIGLSEFAKRTAKSAIRNASMWGFATGGAKIGAAIGTLLHPGIGTGVYVLVGGCFGAVLSAIVGYLTSGAFNSYVIDKYWVVEENETTKKELKEALIWFQFGDPNVVKDPNKFNQDILRQKYKRYVLICHPDRPNGDAKDFIKLNYYYGILKALCEDVPKQNTEIVVEEINPKPPQISNQ